MRTATAALACLLAARSVAAASPLAEALARHAPADVAALREQRTEVAARCTLGAVYAQRGDLPRAQLYLDGCLAAELPDDIGPPIRQHARDTTRRLQESDLAQISINTRPDGMLVETDALPGEAFTAPRDIWVKPGAYRVTATHGDLVLSTTVATEARKRSPAYLAAPAVKPPAAPPPQRVDFGEEAAAEPQQAGPPPNVKHKSLIRGKYAGPPATRAPTGDEIADPLAVTATARRPPRTWWLGVRAGAGIADDAGDTAHATALVAAAARFALAGPWFVAGRVDVGDAFGVGAGAGYRAIRTRGLDLAVLAQLRGDVRSGDMDRLGASVTAGLELAPLATPLTLGLRAEQALTARDGRALLVELGLDWR